MGRPRRRDKDSPIDNRQKALAEQEEKLRLKQQELEQFIRETPGRKKELEIRKRQDLVIRASQPSRRAESPGSLFDKRYDANVSAMPHRRGKSLRAEQQAVRLRSLTLVVLLFVILVLVWKFLS